MASKNIVLKGATWNGVESVDFPVSGGGTARYVETSDADATAADIASGKKAYVNGSLVTGTGSGGSATLKLGVIRPDAELVQSWTYDKYLVADEGVTIPAYTTAGATLLTGGDLTPTYTADANSYYYAFSVRMMTTPVYSSASIGKGRVEYFYYTGVTELKNPSGTFDGNTIDRPSTTTQSFTTSAICYWNSATSLRLYEGNYGPYVTVSTPSYAAATGVFTAKSPSVVLKGSTSYFSQTYWDYLTDIRLQYIIELYRVPLSSLNVDGFSVMSNAQHIIGCADSASGTLT